MTRIDLKVRQARIQDAEDLVRVHYDAVHENASNDYPVETLNSWSPQPDERRYSWMRSQIEAGTNQVLVAELGDGTISGFCMFSANDGFIYAVYVAPGMARNGIGQSLLRCAETSIAEHGIVNARLNASKNALEFYSSAGYQIIEPSMQSLADGALMECFKMRKQLAAAPDR